MKMTIKEILYKDKVQNDYTITDLTKKLKLSAITVRHMLAGSETTQLIIGKFLEAYSISYDEAHDMLEDMVNMRDYATEKRFIDGEQEVKLLSIEVIKSVNGVQTIKVFLEELSKGYKYYETVRLAESKLTQLEKCFELNIVENGVKAINKYLESNDLIGKVEISKVKDTDFISVNYLPKGINRDDILKQ